MEYMGFVVSYDDDQDRYDFLGIFTVFLSQQLELEVEKVNIDSMSTCFCAWIFKAIRTAYISD